MRFHKGTIVLFLLITPEWNKHTHKAACLEENTAASILICYYIQPCLLALWSLMHSSWSEKMSRVPVFNPEGNNTWLRHSSKGNDSITCFSKCTVAKYVYVQVTRPLQREEVRVVRWVNKTSVWQDRRSLSTPIFLHTVNVGFFLPWS